MNFLLAFIFSGVLCGIAQFLMDKFKLLPLHLIVSYVVIGSILEIFGLYDILIDIFGAGALVVISSFGHSLTHAAVEASKELGFIGLFSGMFNITASGISCAIFSAFLMALVFKPRG